MKRLGLLVLLLVAFAVPAMAQSTEDVGDISIYGDDQGNSCDLALAGFNTWFIIQKFDPGDGGATGCRFKLEVPAGTTIQGFNTSFVPIGDIRTDLSLAYGFCINQATVLGSVILTGAPAACTYASVIAAENFANPIATDCSFGEYTVETGQGIVNGGGACPCSVATKPSTWGKVKSLYR